MRMNSIIGKPKLYRNGTASNIQFNKSGFCIFFLIGISTNGK